MNPKIFDILYPQFRAVHLQEYRECVRMEDGGDLLSESELTAVAEQRMKSYLRSDLWHKGSNSVKLAVRKIQSRLDLERNEQHRVAALEPRRFQSVLPA